MTEEIKLDLLSDLQLADNYTTPSLNQLVEGGSRYLKDLRVNLKNVLVTDHLTEKEAALLAVSIAANAKNAVLQHFFTERARALDATEAELGEAVACASLLASNNVFYRFRHFIKKEKYQQLPGRIKMTIMMKPVLGKEFFELISLAVSAANGCEMCVNAHEASLLELGATEERIFDAIRLASVVTSLDKIIY
ncbi:alkyl hydroperoxide reductase subunit D [Catalinimonas alkaloidigena]|uniref:Alkyl hydroperoxide reductase AhpD n=1 Tax=Catalinimonas alkaloidigena TaxID=1075417 RepID=A0A1G9D8D5_9BACT|nr:carboxymuconolactone decarboxylase family protein [Catalinimonas alkaloidigena]SDK59995.1 alkyl hydroperoxide reductase subunit D [Catalinimonas alkaloidigena]